jgi:hypothetical protein
MTDWRSWLERLAPIALLAIIGLALLVPQPAGLSLGAGESERVDGTNRLLDELPETPVVLVAFDPDLGTYAEIRPTVRALLADVVMRGASLAFVSLTVEGRALATTELARLHDAGVGTSRVTDLGYRSGAEAALLDLVRDPLGPVAATGAAAEALVSEGLAGTDLVIVVGGNDLGPRTWVEQASTRVPSLRIAAITPTVLLPEVAPYLSSGQLDALLGTVGDGAAYRDQLGADDGSLHDTRVPVPLPFLAGMVIAIVVLAQAAGGTLPDALRAAGRRG